MRFYQKIRNFGHPETGPLLNGPVVVQEKIDGSNFTFGRELDGQLFCLSRTQKLPLEPGDAGMFRLAVEHVRSIESCLPWGVLFRCEFLSKPKHNLLAYDRVPSGHLVLFGYEAVGEWGLWNHADDPRRLQLFARKFSIELVQEIYRGPVSRENILPMWEDNWKKSEPQLGGPRIEGVVIKNYGVFGPDGQPLHAKIVAKEFHEVRKHDRAAGKPQSVSDVGFRFGGEPRWQKAIQHLREAGMLKGGPEDIGPLLARIHKDVEEECGEEIKAELFKRFRKEVIGGSTRGFVDWYKKVVGYEY